MHDSDPGAPEPISIGDADAWNKKGFGIFWTVNEFHSPVRRITNLKRINSWAIDMDSGTKGHMLYKLNRGLYPSLVVESKRGYHAYWQAIDGSKEMWNEVMIERMVPFYGADKNARDMARILRVPGFYHMKDPQNPFMVREIFRSNAKYTQSQMLFYYQQKPHQVEQKKDFDALKKELKIYGNEFWEKIWNLDCEYALNRLSGHDIVGNELFSFRQTSRGNKNIFVNKKGTSTWIDSSGRIGSLSKGGPTIAQYLKWYGSDWPTIIKTLKEVFPELNKND